MRSCGVSSLSPARLEGCSPSPCQEEVPDTSSSEHRWRPLWEVKAFPEAWAVSSGQVGPRWPSEQARPSVQTQDKKDPALAGRIKVSEGGVGLCEAQSTDMWVAQAAGCRVGAGTE